MVLSFTVGRRGFRHVFCWVAPFMVVGRKLRNGLGWPTLRLKVETEKCVDCRKCVNACPMSLDVNGMVRSGTMESSECILCGTCAELCPGGVIGFSFSSSSGK